MLSAAIEGKALRSAATVRKEIIAAHLAAAPSRALAPFVAGREPGGKRRQEVRDATAVPGDIEFRSSLGQLYTSLAYKSRTGAHWAIHRRPLHGSTDRYGRDARIEATSLTYTRDTDETGRPSGVPYSGRRTNTTTLQGQEELCRLGENLTDCRQPGM